MENDNERNADLAQVLVQQLQPSPTRHSPGAAYLAARDEWGGRNLLLLSTPPRPRTDLWKDSFIYSLCTRYEVRNIQNGGRRVQFCLVSTVTTGRWLLYLTSEDKVGSLVVHVWFIDSYWLKGSLHFYTNCNERQLLVLFENTKLEENVDFHMFQNIDIVLQIVKSRLCLSQTCIYKNMWVPMYIIKTSTMLQ